MKIADVLRQVADAIDQQEAGAPDEKIQNPAELEPIKGGIAVSSPDNVDRTEDELMVPPLQLKTELLKRAVGVDNIYDPGEPRADEAHENQSCDDEIAMLKNRAGIPVAAVMELGNDEIFDD
jgi:hypothetical protein